MRIHLLRLLPAALLALTFSACDSNKPDDGAGEEEFFTRVTLTLAGSDGSTATAAATDPDGDKANIQYTTLALKAGVTYTGAITLRDDINGKDVTPEILGESDEHQFFYTPGGAVTGRLTVTRTDTDANGLPIGLQFRAAVTAGAAASGTLGVVLSHYDGIVKQADVRSPETDLDLTFPVTITP